MTLISPFVGRIMDWYKVGVNILTHSDQGALTGQYAIAAHDVFVAQAAIFAHDGLIADDALNVIDALVALAA